MRCKDDIHQTRSFLILWRRLWKRKQEICGRRALVNQEVCNALVWILHLRIWLAASCACFLLLAVPGIIARIAPVKKKYCPDCSDHKITAEPNYCNNWVADCRPRFRPSMDRLTTRKPWTVGKAENPNIENYCSGCSKKITQNPIIAIIDFRTSILQSEQSEQYFARRGVNVWQIVYYRLWNLAHPCLDKVLGSKEAHPEPSKSLLGSGLVSMARCQWGRRKCSFTKLLG